MQTIYLRVSLIVMAVMFDQQLRGYLHDHPHVNAPTTWLALALAVIVTMAATGASLAKSRLMIVTTTVVAVIGLLVLLHFRSFDLVRLMIILTIAVILFLALVFTEKVIDYTVGYTNSLKQPATDWNDDGSNVTDTNNDPKGLAAVLHWRR